MIQPLTEPGIMNIQVEKVGKVTVIELDGELDSNTSPIVQEQILSLAEKNSRLLLDMTNVTYMSSAGLRTLLVLYRYLTENTGKIVLAGLNDDIRDIMSITGFLDFFSTVNDRHEALKVLR
jgi:anti-sigma B factor antagonist